MASNNKKERTNKRKEMTIVLKSKPLSSDSSKPNKLVLQSNRKPQDAKKKGTRGPSWIG